MASADGCVNAPVSSRGSAPCQCDEAAGGGALAAAVGQVERRDQAGIAIEPVPYRGDAQINSALMAGEVEVAVVPLATGLPLVAACRLRALAVTSARRSAALPDVPTIAESGVPGFASSSWQGFFVAARTPRDIVDRIQRETAKVLQATDVRARLAALTYEPVGSTPEDFAAYFKSELARFAGVVKQAQIPPQD